MRARAFWRIVTADHLDMLEHVLGLFRDQRIPFCLIGGQAVNAYAEPVVSLDLDVAVPASDVARLEELLAQRFQVARFPHSLNVSSERSDLRVQIQTDPRYAGFVHRATVRHVLGLELPVARIEDVLTRKVWAAQDPTRRESKRQKDLADIARLMEVSPELRAQVPEDIRRRLI